MTSSPLVPADGFLGGPGHFAQTSSERESHDLECFVGIFFSLLCARGGWYHFWGIDKWEKSMWLVTYGVGKSLSACLVKQSSQRLFGSFYIEKQIIALQSACFFSKNFILTVITYMLKSPFRILYWHIMFIYSTFYVMWFVSVLLHKNGLSKSVWVIKCESMDYHFFSASHNTNTHNVLNSLCLLWIYHFIVQK